VGGVLNSLFVLLLFLSTTLHVPFISQEGIGWHKNNDCGPAVVEMIYEYYTDDNHTVKELYQELSMEEDLGMSGFVLRQWLKEHGLSAEYDSGLTLDWLLAQSTPVIVEVDYSVLRKAGVLAGESWDLHFLIVVGHMEGYVIVHDPLVGPYQIIPIDIFVEAWSLPYSWIDNPAVVVTDGRN